MAKQHRILTGQVAAITGGARGIGRAMAEAFVREGMRVAIGDVDVDVARQTAGEIGHGTVALELDVTSHESIERFADGVEAELGPIDVFVSNAGIMPVGPFLEENDDCARRQFDINVHGVIFGAKVILPRMIARNRGHLVNIASQAGKFGIPGLATYCATKHAVVGLSDALRGELRLVGADGVSLSVVMPNLVGTELASGIQPTKIAKLLTPEEIAGAVVEALRTGRYEVWVPSSGKGVAAFTGLLPLRAREAVSRAAGADKMMWEVDAGARRNYELRALRGADAVEAGQTPDQLSERAGQP